MKFKFILISCFIFSLNSIAQNFSEKSTPFVQLQYAQVKSVDFDNDGNYDCIVCGSNESYIVECHVYKNNGDFNFIEVESNLQGVSGSIDCRDYDLDGDIDLLISGYKKDSYGAKHYTYLYKNNGNFEFENTNAFTDSIYKNPLWIDFDNDGDDDISCYNNEVSKSYILENKGNDEFIESLELPRKVSHWYDVDKNGFKDYVSYEGALFLYDSGMYIRSYSLIDSLSSNFNYKRKPFLFNDFDADGNIDVLVSRGWNDYTPHIHQSHILINDSALFDSIAYSEFIGITSQGILQAIDTENDGDLDVFISGCCNEDDANLYRNDSLWHYSSIPFFFSTIYNTSSVWVDIDSDNDLDILIAGNDYNKMVKLFENDTIIANNAPSIPTNLNVDVDSCYTIFSWDKSTDTETPRNGISYNIYIGTHADSMNIVSANSNRVSGKLLFPHNGNCGLNDYYIIKDLDTSRTYYWGVQAIDYLHKTSDFNKSIYKQSNDIVDTIVSTISNQTIQNQLSIFPNPTSSYVTIKFNKDNNITKFDLISIEGKLLATYYNNNELLQKIDLPQKGIFIIRFYNHEEILSRKIIKNR